MAKTSTTPKTFSIGGKYAARLEPRGDNTARYVITGGSAKAPYVVTLTKGWNGARCSCPDGIFRARKLGRPCKHEALVRNAIAHA
jgi:predicted nucleic acid-binding Zn finger protein